jgi:hypothetical protein
MPDNQFVTALLNMIVAGFRMHENVFVLLGEGTPQLPQHVEVSGPNSVSVRTKSGTYTVTVTHEPEPEETTQPQ